MAELGLLVVGAGRGGTSLLAGLLDSHPRLECGLEWHVEHLLDPECEPRTRLRRFREGCERSAAASSAPIWGNKVTTEEIRAVAAGSDADPLELFFAEFSDVPVVFILRDGRACVESKVRRTGQPYEEAARRWRFSVAAYRFLRGRAEVLTITFEALVNEPRRTLRAVCDFLQLPFDERMLEGTTNSKLIPEYRRERVDPSRAAIPELPAETLRAIEDDLRACGYVGDVS